jgi:hypothetical protein
MIWPLIALLPVVSACSSSVRQARTLRFLGDSITWQSTSDIKAHYAHDKVTITGYIGFDTDLMMAVAVKDAAASPDDEVINLGTNDANLIAKHEGIGVLEPRPPTMRDVLGRLDAMAAQFPSTTCVIFVTVNTHNPSWGPTEARTIDDHIRSTFHHVVDWDGAWKPSYFNGADNPHPNETGRQALLKLEDRAIARCP